MAVGPDRGKCPSVPSLGQFGAGAAAALAVRTTRNRAVVGLATTKELGVPKSDANSDGMGWLAGVVNSGTAPERPDRGICVLVPDRVPVVRPKRLPGPPFPTEALAFDSPDRVAGERHVVVLVCLPDDAEFVGPNEVDGNLQVACRHVGKSMGSHLIRHIERISDVFDGNVSLLSCLLEEGDQRHFGHQGRAREVIRFDSLLEEISKVLRFRMIERKVAQCLQDHGSACPNRYRVALGNVNAPVSHIGERTNGSRQLSRAMNGEAKLCGHCLGRSLGKPPSGVAGTVDCPGGDLFDLFEVVATSSHLGPQLGVGDPCFFASRHGDLLPTFELAKQAEDVL